ncbi:MAG: hypothetical protein U5L96_09640 [Owenweeksia sp.]|nr:hypothetical protein [Owenweeksia sp.]
MYPEPTSFKGWRYAQDSSRVSFYRPETMRFIAGKFGYQVIPSEDKDVSIMQKAKPQEELKDE